MFSNFNPYGKLNSSVSAVVALEKVPVYIIIVIEGKIVLYRNKLPLVITTTFVALLSILLFAIDTIRSSNVGDAVNFMLVILYI